MFSLNLDKKDYIFHINKEEDAKIFYFNLDNLQKDQNSLFKYNIIEIALISLFRILFELRQKKEIKFSIEIIGKWPNNFFQNFYNLYQHYEN